MTAEEVYESVTNGGASDFATAVEIFERFGPWCLIGGLAVNCYVQPVYTVDADFVISSPEIQQLQEALRRGLECRGPKSDLKVELCSGSRYEEFPGRAERREVLGLTVPVAALDDVIRGKTWAWQDKSRRLTKRKKDELDLLRLAEAYPHLASSMPEEIVRQLEPGA